MKFSSVALLGIPTICMFLFACGRDENKTQSIQDRFAAIYGYTDCEGVVLGTGLTQSIWTRVFQTYSDGFLDLKETTFLDQDCKTSYTSVNRWATYEILDSSSEETGEIHLQIQTRRILAGTSDYALPELPGIPGISCNAEMAEDLRKVECGTYFNENQYISRYVTVNLSAEGLTPFKDIDSAGTTVDARSTELASYVLDVLDTLDK